jgi:hypothetical protein
MISIRKVSMIVEIAGIKAGVPCVDLVGAFATR